MDIVLFKRSSTNLDAHEITHIKETNQYYDPLHYVLIFPFSECGWTVKVYIYNNIIQGK